MASFLLAEKSPVAWVGPWRRVLAGESGPVLVAAVGSDEAGQPGPRRRSG